MVGCVSEKQDVSLIGCRLTIDYDQSGSVRQNLPAFLVIFRLVAGLSPSLDRPGAGNSGASVLLLAGNPMSAYAGKCSGCQSTISVCMKMKRIYLHVGLPKTGTSYLQNWLNGNRSLLRNKNIWIPSKPLYPHRVAVEFITNSVRAARSDVVSIKHISYEEARRDLADALASSEYESGIISSEYFFECEPGNLDPLRAELSNLEVIIVLFLRRQDRIIESGFNQEVKAMRQKASLSRPRYFERLDWLRLYKKWSDGFGRDKIRLVNYDEVSKKNRLLPEFLRVTELPDSIMVGAQELPHLQNESLPANLLEFKRLSNEVDFPELQYWLFDAIKMGVPAPPFRLTPEIACQHLSFYAESNAELSRILDPSGSSELFPPYEQMPGAPGADYTNNLPLATLVQLFVVHLKQEQEAKKALLQRVLSLEEALASLTKTVSDRGSPGSATDQ